MSSGPIECGIQALVQGLIAEALGGVKSGVADEVARLEKLIEGLSERCTGLDTTMQELRVAADQRSGETSMGVEQLKADLEALGTTLRSRLERFESDEEGGGGLEQLRERTERLKQELGAFDPKLQSQAKATSALRSRLDTLEETSGGLRGQWDAVRESIEKSSATLAGLEASRASVEERQTALEDRLAQKHEELWQDVHRAVEEARKDSTRALEQDMAKRKGELKTYAHSHVKYVTQLLASTHTERKSMEMCKGLLQVWKEQTWADARRRAGLRLLATSLGRAGERRERRAFQRWSFATSIESLSDRLRKEYEAQIPDVQGIVGERCGKLEGDLDGLRGDITGIRGELELKCSTAQLLEAVDDHTAKLSSHAGEVEQVKARIEEHKEALAETDGKHHCHREALEAHKSDVDAMRSEHTSRLTGIDERIAAVDTSIEERFAAVDASFRERLEAHAKAEEVQNMMRDVLLIWNSLKQIDAAKADKVALDSFAMEVTSSYTSTAKKAEDLQAELGGKVQEETSRLREDVHAKVTHWEHMWGKLAGLVEDLITKVGNLQAREHAGPMGHSGAAAASRTGSPTNAVGSLSREGSATALHGDTATMRPSSLPQPPPASRRTASTPSLRGAAAGSPAAAIAALHASAGEATPSPSPHARSSVRSVTPEFQGVDRTGVVNGMGPAPLPPFRAPARPPSRPGSASARTRAVTVGSRR